MKIAKNLTKHVFCLEGDWNLDLRNKSSISAALEFLQTNCGVKYIHKNCGTKENLQYYLKLWKQKRYTDYTICYLAFHGIPETIKVGKEEVNLDELAQMLNGSCRNKIIHFGSCNTLDTDERNIRRFLETTQALCVCGFKTDIDYLESSAFDMLLIEHLQQYKDISRVHYTLRKDHRRLIRKLDFRMLYQ